MTDSDWVSRRTPPPPEELASAIRAALKARNIDSDSPGPAELLETAQSLLERVLRTECAARDSALDLLTADALVTYALEAANDDRNAPGDFATAAVRQLSRAGNRAAGEPEIGPAGSRS